MDNWLQRTEMLIGKEKINKLKNSTVAVFGVGGVGSLVAESLVRAGIGKIVLIDKDVVDVTNINRQLIADVSNIGKPKVEVAKERYLKINPELNVDIYQIFFNEDTSSTLDFSSYNYIADCIDTVKSKLLLIELATKQNISIISSMGTGNKLDPTRFEISDIYKTSVCPLAKVIRKELKSREIDKLKVVYSKEEPHKFDNSSSTPASISFVPSSAGLIIASEIVKDLIK